MGQKQTKEEQIIVQAAGTGNNEATEKQQVTWGATQWLLVAIIALLVLFAIYYVIKKAKEYIRTLARKEILRSAVKCEMNKI